MTELKSINPLSPVKCVDCGEDCRRHYWDCGNKRILCPKCQAEIKVKEKNK